MSDSRLPEPRGFTRPASSDESRVIDAVLQQTSQALVARQPLTALEKQAVDDVARRMRGKPLETVVAELVLAVLKQHISALPGFGEFGPALSQRVAATLLDDPVAKPRLEALWNGLQTGGPA